LHPRRAGARHRWHHVRRTRLGLAHVDQVRRQAVNRRGVGTIPHQFTKEKLMRAMVLVVIGALAAGGCSSSGQSPVVHSDKSMIESAKAVDTGFVAAFNTGDADKAASYYWNSPDLVVYLPAAMECRGWQAAHDELERIFKETPNAKLKLL